MSARSLFLQPCLTLPFSETSKVGMRQVLPSCCFIGFFWEEDWGLYGSIKSSPRTQMLVVWVSRGRLESLCYCQGQYDRRGSGAGHDGSSFFILSQEVGLKPVVPVAASQVSLFLMFASWFCSAAPEVVSRRWCSTPPTIVKCLHV